MFMKLIIFGTAKIVILLIVVHYFSEKVLSAVSALKTVNYEVLNCLVRPVVADNKTLFSSF